MSNPTPTPTTTTVYPSSGDYIIVLHEDAVWRDADEIERCALAVSAAVHSVLDYASSPVGLTVEVEDSALSPTGSPGTSRTFHVWTDGYVLRICWGELATFSQITLDTAAASIDVTTSPVVPAWATDPEEVPEHEVWAAILRVLPDAEFSADEDGFLTVSTGLLYCGRHGENLIGRVHLT
jgi:hypothetical protein